MGMQREKKLIPDTIALIALFNVAIMAITVQY